MDLHPTLEGLPILPDDSWYRSWNTAPVGGSWNIWLPGNQLFLAYLGYALECGLIIGCSQGNAILWGKKTCLTYVFTSVQLMHLHKVKRFCASSWHDRASFLKLQKYYFDYCRWKMFIMCMQIQSAGLTDKLCNLSNIFPSNRWYQF